jgi:hypothetical protein
MRNVSRKQRIIKAGATLLVLGVVGLVYAQWTTNGSGSGYAKAGTAQNLSTNDVSANVTTDPANQLYPGTDGDVLVQIHNPNPYPVTVTQIGTGSGSVSATGGTGTCTTTGVSLNSPQTVSIAVPANGDSAETTVTDAAHMSGSTQTGCQGATFTIPVSLTGASNAS